jgi:hypothetical protein
MDQLDRVLQQVKDAESDIYETMMEDHGMDRIVNHPAEESFGLFFDDPSAIPTGNLDIARESIASFSGSAREDMEGYLAQLEDLMRARASIFEAKVMVAQEYNDKVANGNAAHESDMRAFVGVKESFDAAVSAGQAGSAYCKQVTQIRETDMQALMDNMNRFDAVAAQRDSLYSDFAVENT